MVKTEWKQYNINLEVKVLIGNYNKFLNYVVSKNRAKWSGDLIAYYNQRWLSFKFLFWYGLVFAN